MSEGFDCVFGSRFCKSGKITKSSPVRFLISFLGGCLTNLLLGTKLSDMTSGFELFTRKALKHALRKGIRSRGHFFQTEIKVHCRNLKIAEVPIHYQSASPSVKLPILLEALRNLARLFAQRLLKAL
jgi:dolichol-phosphate mannosyltransferase